MAQNGQDSRVAPLATEVHVLTQQPFLLHAQLLQDAARRDVLVVDGRPNSVQLGLSKSGVHDGSGRFGGIPEAPEWKQ